MIAFLFPGQGSQFSGMGKDLADNFSAARLVFEEANDALGFDISRMCFSGSEEDLKLTANTQPAILTVSIAALRVLEQETELKADYSAGHSLGEYSALVSAGAFRLADAVKTVRQRGTFMQEAVPVGVGAMAAVMGLERAELEQICQDAAQGEVVSPANFNSPGQIVIAGHATAVGRAIELCKAQGAKRALPLPVSAPFHSSLMEPAAQRLETVLSKVTVNPLQCPVISNVMADACRDQTLVKQLLVEQVCAPVRWDESVVNMVELGVKHFIEIGPGKVLSGLVKRITKGSNIKNIGAVADLDKLQG
ncbi:MAG TPA: ACP S-malonyltransferase [Geopsychrobacteraceae bacterium]|nr:ACP S-malonyltransferase [Geopsychrobacteraceae bacterium]